MLARGGLSADGGELVVAVRLSEAHMVEAHLAEHLGRAPEEAVTLLPGAKGVGRKPTVTLTARSVTKTIDEWATDRKINRSTIEERLRRGWSDEDALFRPVRGQ